MNRREILKAFRDFCILYGIQGVLVPEAFGQAVTTKKRFVSFVVKYTGGATVYEGPGPWNFNDVLKPLAPYQGQIAIPMGLNCQFNVPMNSHASPQISALTGASTGAVQKPDAYYPDDILQNNANPGGKSIDVLIGEKLQSTYNTQIPFLNITNYSNVEMQASTFSASSWSNSKLLPAFDNVNNLSQELKNRINCTATTDAGLKAAYERKLAALDYVKKNSLVFDSKFIINKDQFENLEAKLQKGKDLVNNALANPVLTKPAICGNFPSLPTLPSEYYGDYNSVTAKMGAMYDLAIAAMANNVTRAVTINLYAAYAHEYSHYLQSPPIDNYLKVATNVQQLIALFLGKLKTAGLYDETLVFCNAGSCMSNEVHNYENLSTWVLNGDKAGVLGTVTNKKPIGSLLIDMASKFGLNYTEFGGRDHIYGVAKRGFYI